MHDELNYYLNEIFIELEEKNSFFINNIVRIAQANDKIYFSINECKIDLEKKENKLSFEDVYLLAREIIESINSKYLKEYDSLIETGKLNFNYEKNENHNGSYYELNDNGDTIIEIDREFNYNDVIILIHEFFHSTNLIPNSSNARYLLTEFISIYFEIFVINYLKNNGFDIDNYTHNFRIDSIKRHSKTLMQYEFPFLVFSKFGNINEMSISFFQKYYVKMKRELFEKKCKNLLKKIELIDGDYKKRNNEYDIREYRIHMSEIFRDDYKYIFCSVLAYYAIKYCDINDIVKLNDTINDYSVRNMSVNQILKSIKIDISFDMLDKAIESIYEHLNRDNNLIKKY